MVDTKEPTEQSIPAKPLPSYLVKRHRGWHATEFAQNRTWYTRLADEGQRPRAMVISCCDSRVHVTSIFGAESGEFFIHRNIAGLIPPYQPDEDHHGTSAAIEYAVVHLKVTNIMLVGHSSCGGIEGCYDMCRGEAPELEARTSFVGRWMDILRPGYEKVAQLDIPRTEQLEALEKEAIQQGLINLMDFPFVASRVEDGSLDLHGLWNNIRTGTVEWFDPATKGFQPV